MRLVDVVHSWMFVWLGFGDGSQFLYRSMGGIVGLG